MKRIHVVISALALVALVCGWGGSASAVAPANRSDAPPASWDAVLRSALDAGLTGVALRVERGDEVVFDGAAGLANREAQTPVAPTDRFRIASITKTFTAVLVLQLVDQGVLTLDDTVTRWLENPVVARIPYVDRITIRQLLNHTSGVYDYFDDDSPFWQDAYFGPDADWARVWTPLELLAYADGARHAPYFLPGEGSHYSNTGYVLLGLIVERAGEASYAEQMHARIAAPLGLTDTFFAATEAVPGGTADAYHLIEGELVNATATHSSALGAAGGMVSSTRDLARFLDALLGGELLRPARLAEMMTFVPSQWPGNEWGLGLAHRQSPGGLLLGHSGDGPGSAARMFRVADTDLTIVLLTNTGGDDAIVDTVFAQAVQAALGEAGPNA